MGRLKSILGYTAAVLATFIVLATFMGNDYFSYKFASATGIKVSPRYTGGEIVKVVEHGTYTTIIHRPVYDGLLGERKDGFIQIKWKSVAGLPPVIHETVDYDGDNKADLLVTLDTATGETMVVGYNPAVVSVKKTYRLDTGWAVRILLRKTS
ncbi:MAG TPA: hypothetical protein VMC85_16915 [Desulfomonilaceae bacterium]|nr:hypothetical protein [Desulfomonilaceae bacterium]